MNKGSAAKFYIDADGNYLGAYCGVQQLLGTYDDDSQIIIIARQNPVIPLGAIEVPSCPTNAFQKWDAENNAWLPLTV